MEKQKQYFIMRVMEFQMKVIVLLTYYQLMDSEMILKRHMG